MKAPTEVQINFENAMTGLSKFNWDVAATEFFIGNSYCHSTNMGGRPIYIGARGHMDGSVEWVVKMHQWVLGKNGKFHWEPVPSERTPEYLQMTRYSSRESALSELINFQIRHRDKDMNKELPVPSSEEKIK